MVLKPCPFCGSQPIIKDWTVAYETGTTIRCLHCGACITESVIEEENWHEKAIEKWNSRVGNSKTMHDWDKDELFEKYELQLLTRKIRLWDVPESLRRDPEWARGIYIIGFRADRMVSKESYEEDLLKLKVEITLIEADGNQPILLERLQAVLDEMQYNLKLFDIYKISDFH